MVNWYTGLLFDEQDKKLLSLHRVQAIGYDEAVEKLSGAFESAFVPGTVLFARTDDELYDVLNTNPAREKTGEA